jgi:hypothetical protein
MEVVVVLGFFLGLGHRRHSMSPVRG